MIPLYAADRHHVSNIDGMGLNGFGIVDYAVHVIRFVKKVEGTEC